MQKTGKILIFFGLFWTALTLLFDWTLLVPAVRQVIALRFSTTQGAVLSSEITEHDGDDGPTYGVKLSYRFRAGGREVIGQRYRYDKSTTSGSGWARRVVAAHPPGTNVMVYYDPDHPENCVLRPGLAGSDLFHFTFMTPFNAVMLGFWGAGWEQLRRKWLKPTAGGVRLTWKLRQTRARLTNLSPLATGLAVSALLAFLSIFVVGFGFGGFRPPLQIMIVAWVIILAGGGLAALWHGARVLRGEYDLVIDELKGTLLLPLSGGRKSRLTLRMTEVQSAFVRVEEKRDSESTSYSYLPTLRLAGDNGRTEELAKWYDEAKAREFVAWLNEQLRHWARPSAPFANPSNASTSE